MLHQPLTMRALIKTSLIAFAVGCANQQPAESPSDTAAEEPIQVVARSADGTEQQVRPATGTAATPLPNRDTSAEQQRTNEAALPTPSGTARSTSEPDNTRVNERDTREALTPLDQGENQSDRDATQFIRKAVMGDDSLSFTAKNVKIITVGGKVTLRGPVNSTRERSAIEAAAKRAPGVTSVDNQLEVKP